MKIYYVYRITNISENKHYYGQRCLKITPENDLGVLYYSSSKDKTFIEDQKQNPDDYKYKIIRHDLHLTPSEYPCQDSDV